MTADTLWAAVVADFESRLPPTSRFAAWAIWFQMVRPEMDGPVLVLVCRHDLARNWIARHYTQQIREAVDQLAPQTPIRLTVEPQPPPVWPQMPRVPKGRALSTRLDRR